MVDLLYGNQMKDKTFFNGDCRKWIFPKDCSIESETLYEVEYTIKQSGDLIDWNCLYTVTSIKPVSKLMSQISIILEKFNSINSTKDFEEWFNNYFILKEK